MYRTPPSAPARSEPWIDMEKYRSRRSSTGWSALSGAVRVTTGSSRPPADRILRTPSSSTMAPRASSTWISPASIRSHT